MRTESVRLFSHLGIPRKFSAECYRSFLLEPIFFSTPNIVCIIFTGNGPSFCFIMGIILEQTAGHISAIITAIFGISSSFLRCSSQLATSHLLDAPDRLS